MSKRSLTVAGHRTSVSLEDPFWAALAEIARQRRISATALVAEIDKARPPKTNLSAAIRLAILAFYRERHGRN